MYCIIIRWLRDSTKRGNCLRRSNTFAYFRNYIVEDEGNNVWKINIAGPEQTPFEGGHFVVKFKLEGFPFKAPVVSFETKIYHPNVEPNGGICADMLEIGEKWAPVKNLVTIMNKIKSLMVAPNVENAMNP